MRRFALALVASLGLAAISPLVAKAEVDLKATQWTVYDYNASDQAIAPRTSPDSRPATTPDGGVTWQFQFKSNVYTALFTTTDPGLTGNLTGKTLTEDLRLDGDAVSFVTQNGGGDCTKNVPAVVRFYFTSPSAAGPSTGAPPAGFYTQSWWSDAVNVQMISGNQGQPPISESMTPADWSDWNGQPAATQTAAFMEAVQHVQSIGLSFGGDCFFETGVTPTPSTFSSEQFSSTFSES